MTTILQEYISLFGLNYQPTTFAELFTWLVLVMCAISIVCGIIRCMFGVCTLSLKAGEKR